MNHAAVRSHGLLIKYSCAQHGIPTKYVIIEVPEALRSHSPLPFLFFFFCLPEVNEKAMLVKTTYNLIAP